MTGLLGGRHSQRAAAGRSRGGQKDLKSRAFANAALHGDPALMLLDDAINRGQAQAGAAVHFLGGEKRLENPAQIFRRDAAAGVAERSGRQTARAPPPGSAARRRQSMATAEVLMRNWPPRGMASRELTARLSSTCSIMPRSALIEGRPGEKSTLQGDVLAQDAPEHFGDIVDDFVQIHHLRMNSCLRLNVINCRVSAPARLPASTISLSESAPLGVSFSPASEQAGVAVDDGQEIVEIMGDAPGQLADGLHFLRLAQLRLQAQPLRHVHGQRQVDFLRQNVMGGDFHLDEFAALGAMPPDAGIGRARRRLWTAFPEKRADPRAGPSRARSAQELLLGITVMPDGGLVDADEGQSRVVIGENGSGIAVEQKPVLVFGSLDQRKGMFQFQPCAP